LVETLSDERRNCQATSATTCESCFKWNISRSCCYSNYLHDINLIKCYCFLLEADQKLLAVIDCMVKIDSIESELTRTLSFDAMIQSFAQVKANRPMQIQIARNDLSN